MKPVMIFGVALLLSGLVACGGRVAKPVAEKRDTDARLSCAHVTAEAEVNAARILDLLGEIDEARDQNAAKLLAAPVSIAFPFFLDLGDSERQEIEALERRNRHLATLAEAKGCPLSE